MLGAGVEEDGADEGCGRDGRRDGLEVDGGARTRCWGAEAEEGEVWEEAVVGLDARGFRESADESAAEFEEGRWRIGLEGDEAGVPALGQGDESLHHEVEGGEARGGALDGFLAGGEVFAVHLADE